MPASDVLSPADITEFRGLLQDLAWPDPYEVLRPTGDVDEFNNTVAGTPAVVEVGMCALSASGLSPQERVTADKLGWEVPMVVELRYDTLLTPSDRLRVNGRELEVGGVSKEGRWGISASAVVREVG
jgi:SPP1 family predicted phage head-tail adaptor